MSSMSGSQGMGNKIPKGYETGRIQNFTPEQMKLFSTSFSQLGPDSYLGKIAGGDQAMFDQMEAPAFRQFNQLQGEMGSRFSGMGMGARKGSGFQNTANQAASDFAQDLQSRRMELQRQATKDLWGMSQDLMGQRPYENFLVEKDEEETPWWKSMIKGVAPIAGGILGSMVPVIGTAAGMAAGSAASNAF